MPDPLFQTIGQGCADWLTCHDFAPAVVTDPELGIERFVRSPRRQALHDANEGSIDGPGTHATRCGL